MSFRIVLDYFFQISLSIKKGNYPIKMYVVFNFFHKFFVNW